MLFNVRGIYKILQRIRPLLLLVCYEIFFFFFAKNIVQCNVMRTSNVRESYYDLK